MARRAKKEKDKKYIIIGNILILIGIGMILFDTIPDVIKNKNEKKALEEFYINSTPENYPENKIIENTVDKVDNQEKIKYIAVLRIKKIDLEKGIVGKESQLRNRDFRRI